MPLRGRSYQLLRRLLSNDKKGGGLFFCRLAAKPAKRYGCDAEERGDHRMRDDVFQVGVMCSEVGQPVFGRKGPEDYFILEAFDKFLLHDTATKAPDLVVLIHQLAEGSGRHFEKNTVGQGLKGKDTLAVLGSGEVWGDHRLTHEDSCGERLLIFIAVVPVRDAFQLKILEGIESLFRKDDIIFAAGFDAAILHNQ